MFVLASISYAYGSISVNKNYVLSNLICRWLSWHLSASGQWVKCDQERKHVSYDASKCYIYHTLVHVSCNAIHRIASLLTCNYIWIFLWLDSSETHLIILYLTNRLSLIDADWFFSPFGFTLIKFSFPKVHFQIINLWGIGHNHSAIQWLCFDACS